MEKEPNLQLFEAGENTALVCVDHEQYQKMVSAAVDRPEVQSARGTLRRRRAAQAPHLFLRRHCRLRKLQGLNSREQSNSATSWSANPAAQRREQFVVLLSHRLPTNDSLAAFVHSVDRIVNIADLPNFKPVLRRGMTEHREKYHFFQSTLKTVQAL